MRKAGFFLQEGLAMIDDGDPDGQRRFWFPCSSGDAIFNIEGNGMDAHNR